MNIFIIGPEGAGKTVFATMLNAYVARNPACGMVFQSADIMTKKYLAAELNLLERGEWPASTKGGKMVSLNWRWVTDGQTSEVSLIDPAGQDIRRELCGDTKTLQIVDSITRADLLILLVDLYGYQQENDEKRVENGWIVEHVLDKLTDQQNLVFAVTKADMLTGSLPRDKWGDSASVLELVKSMMPQFNLTGYQQRVSGHNCAVLAFSSVATTENRDQGGVLVRLPKNPLASDGMDMVVQTVLSAWQEKTKKAKQAAADAAEAERAAAVAAARKKRAIVITRLVGGLGLVVVLYFLYWFCRSVL